jgi:hypothetical protein
MNTTRGIENSHSPSSQYCTPEMYHILPSVLILTLKLLALSRIEDLRGGHFLLTETSIMTAEALFYSLTSMYQNSKSDIISHISAQYKNSSIPSVFPHFCLCSLLITLPINIAAFPRITGHELLMYTRAFITRAGEISGNSST